MRFEDLGGELSEFPVGIQPTPNRFVAVGSNQRVLLVDLALKSGFEFDNLALEAFLGRCSGKLLETFLGRFIRFVIIALVLFVFLFDRKRGILNVHMPELRFLVSPN